MVMSLIESLTRIKNAVYGREVREAIHDGVFRANQIADGADTKADATQIRQDAVEQYNNQMITEMTDKDVISAPELIESRDGEVKLSARLDRDFGVVDAKIDDTKLDLESQIMQAASNLEDAITERGISIKALGAKGDMSEDASPYIMQALDYVNSPNALTKTVFIPHGKYLVNSDILLDGWGFNIVGEGRYSELVAGEGIELAVIRSRSEERVRDSALRSVKIENIHVNGDKRDIYGVLMDGFNRGCQFNNNRVTQCAKAQVAINGSWCFTFNYNVLEGIITGFVSAMDYTGHGLVLGDEANPAIYIATTVNMPTIIGNSFQYLNVGLRYKYGQSAIITGNTFESCINGFTWLQYVRGGIYQGNYHEINKSGGGVRIGAVNPLERTLGGWLFSGNLFEAKMTTATGHWYIDNMVNCTIENNFYVDTTREIVVGSGVTPTNAFGNRIQVTPGRILENATLDRTVNEVYWKKFGDRD